MQTVLVTSVFHTAWSILRVACRKEDQNLIFEYFSNLSRKFKFRQNFTRITGTLHEDLCTFMISRSILLRMRNISETICGENQNTYFMFKNFFPGMVPFMR
jgi:hypothetical protein